MVKRIVVGAHYGLRDWLPQRGPAGITGAYTLSHAPHVTLDSGARQLQRRAQARAARADYQGIESADGQRDAHRQRIWIVQPA